MIGRMDRINALVLCLSLGMALTGCGGVVELLVSSEEEEEGFDAEFLEYLEQGAYKAFVIAIDDQGASVWGRAWGALTIREAVDLATYYCNEGRRSQSIDPDCELYAVNDEVVLDYSDLALSQLFARYRSMSER